MKLTHISGINIAGPHRTPYSIDAEIVIINTPAMNSINHDITVILILTTNCLPRFILASSDNSTFREGLLSALYVKVFII